MVSLKDFKKAHGLKKVRLRESKQIAPPRDTRVVLSNFAWVPKHTLGGPSVIQRLREQLTVHPRSTSPHNPEPDPIELFQENDEMFGIPRDYFSRKTSGRFDVDLRLSSGFPMGFESKIKLWDNQLEPVLTITEVLNKGLLGGILEAPCGTGKTVMALEIARRLGKTTLVVVHKEFILDQWKERIAELLPDAVIGTVWQDHIKFRNCDFVVAMLGSLLSRRYASALYEWPGLVITDEVHRIGAPTWCQAISQFHSKWRLGLSATPNRKDRADNVFLYNIGKVLYRCEEQRRQPRVKRIKTGVIFPAATSAFDPDKAGVFRYSENLSALRKRILPDRVRIRCIF